MPSLGVNWHGEEHFGKGRAIREIYESESLGYLDLEISTLNWSSAQSHLGLTLGKGPCPMLRFTLLVLGPSHWGFLCCLAPQLSNWSLLCFSDLFLYRSASFSCPTLYPESTLPPLEICMVALLPPPGL